MAIMSHQQNSAPKTLAAIHCTAEARMSLTCVADIVATILLNACGMVSACAEILRSPPCQTLPQTSSMQRISRALSAIARTMIPHAGHPVCATQRGTLLPCIAACYESGAVIRQLANACELRHDD